MSASVDTRKYHTGVTSFSPKTNIKKLLMSKPARDDMIFLVLTVNNLYTNVAGAHYDTLFRMYKYIGLG